MKRSISILLVFLLLSVFVSFSVCATDMKSWEGSYRWVNPTNKTNGGKIATYELELREAPSDSRYPLELYYRLDTRSLRLFPLIDDIIGSDEWIPYESISDYGEAYRINAEVFNTTKFTPNSWKLKSQAYADGTFESIIVTKVMGLQFSFTSRMTLVTLPDASKALLFSMKGTGIASWGMFKNPKPGPLEDEWSFLLIRQHAPR